MSNWENSILKIKDENVQWRLDFTKYLKLSTKYNGYRFFWELIPMIYFVTGKKDIAWTDKNSNIYLNIPHRKVDLENEKWEFIYYHECLHQLFETFEVEKSLKEEQGKDFSHYILNVASDCIINHYLKYNCNLDYPSDSIITPEYLSRKYKIEYNPKEDNQYDMYMKLYAIRDQLKSDAIIQQALENMPDVDLDIEGGDGKMPKLKKVPSTADWKLGSKEARHVANNILAKYCDAAQRLPNGKLSKEEAIRVMSEAAAEIQKTLLGKPVRPAGTAAKESFSFHVMSSTEFIAEAALGTDTYSTFEQGWDYAINDVLSRIQQTIMTYELSGGGKGSGKGPDGDGTDPKDDDDEEIEVPENDPTEESPFLPQANQTGDGSLSEPSDEGGNGSDGDSDPDDSDSNDTDKNDNPIDKDSQINKMDGDDAAESAQKSADAAQQSADAAKNAADEAEEAADNALDDSANPGSTSKKDLENAARKARKAADKAQEAANDAQEAADKARDAAAQGNDDEARQQAKEAAHAASDARKQAQKAAENNMKGQDGTEGDPGESKAPKQITKKAEPKKARQSGETLDWDKINRDTEKKEYGGKTWGDQVAEITTFAANNKFGDMNGSDVKNIIKRMLGGMDSSLSGFVKKCKDSKSLKSGKIVVVTTMEKKNASWSQKFSGIIKNTVKQRVKKKLNEWRKTYNRPNRRQGVYHDGDPLKKGKIREKDRLTISLAYYVDVSGSMSDSSVYNIFSFIQKMNNGISKQYRGNSVVEDCMFKVFAFNREYKEITLIPAGIPSTGGGTEPLLNIVRKMKSFSETYMINVIVTDGEMDYDIPAVKAELQEFAGNIVFITNDSNLASVLQPLTHMSGGVCGNKFELITVDSNFNISTDDFKKA